MPFPLRMSCCTHTVCYKIQELSRKFSGRRLWLANKLWPRDSYRSAHNPQPSALQHTSPSNLYADYLRLCFIRPPACVCAYERMPTRTDWPRRTLGSRDLCVRICGGKIFACSTNGNKVALRCMWGARLKLYAQGGG